MGLVNAPGFAEAASPKLDQLLVASEPLPEAGVELVSEELEEELEDEEEEEAAAFPLLFPPE